MLGDLRRLREITETSNKPKSIRELAKNSKAIQNMSITTTRSTYKVHRWYRNFNTQFLYAIRNRPTSPYNILADEIEKIEHFHDIIDLYNGIGNIDPIFINFIELFCMDSIVIKTDEELMTELNKIDREIKNFCCENIYF